MVVWGQCLFHQKNMNGQSGVALGHAAPHRLLARLGVWPARCLPWSSRPSPQAGSIKQPRSTMHGREGNLKPQRISRSWNAPCAYPRFAQATPLIHDHMQVPTGSMHSFCLPPCILQALATLPCTGKAASLHSKQPSVDPTTCTQPHCPMH